MPTDDAKTPWWKGASIYQIYPRSFLDTNGDGIGDLKGILEGLDHIASLGVDAVWISPFFTSPMADFGYDVSDYCDVDPIFGSLDDFKTLLSKAHDLGLKIIIDQVYSHTSEDHEWFAESRADRTNAKADWYVWADPKPDGAPPSNWQSVFGGSAWQWDGRRQQYYLHNFLRSQPDLNVRNSEVQNALLDAARFWLELGVDGFRLDAINFAMHDPQFRDNPPSGLPIERVTRPFDMQAHVYNQSQPDIVQFLEKLRSVTDEYGDIYTVAEVVGPDPIHEMRAFTEGEKRLTSAYNFDFLYADRLVPEKIRETLSLWGQSEDEGWPAWAFCNHDAPRAVSRWGDEKRPDHFAKLYLMLLCCFRGNIFLYQGEELGLRQGNVTFEDLQDPEAIENWPRTLGRDGARVPFPWDSAAAYAGFSTAKPWLPVDEQQAARALDTQTGTPDSVLAFAKSILKLRNQSKVLRIGDLRFLDSPDGMLIIERTYKAERLIGVFNLTETLLDWPDMLGAHLTPIMHVGDCAPGQPLPSQSGIILQP